MNNVSCGHNLRDSNVCVESDCEICKQQNRDHSNKPENSILHSNCAHMLTHISSRVRSQDFVVTRWIALRTEVVEKNSQGLFSSETSLHGFTTWASEAEGGCESCVVRWGLSRYSIGIALLSSLETTEQRECSAVIDLPQPHMVTPLVLEYY